MGRQIVLNRSAVGRAIDPSLLRKHILDTAASPLELQDWTLPEGFPIPFDRHSRQINEIIFCYLIDRFLPVGPTRASKDVHDNMEMEKHAERQLKLSARYRRLRSAEAAAKDLIDFESFLHAFRKDWFDICPADIDAYCDVMASTISPVTARSYAENTVARRENSVRQFYSWAFACDFVTDARFAKVYVRQTHGRRIDSLPLAHTASYSLRLASFQRNRASGRVAEAPAPLDVSSWRSIAHALGPLEQDQESSLSTCVRLASECGIQIGLRSEEVCWLTKGQILRIRLDPSWSDNRTTILQLERAKRGRIGPVHIPVWLVKLLLTYIEGERERNVRFGMSRSNIVFDHGFLFVNGTARTEHTGRKLTENTLSRRFREAVRSAGFTTTEIRFDPDSGERLAFDVPKHSFHDLRHTYAVWTYYRRLHDGDPSPWLFISKQLRHADHRTTERFYLASTHEFEAHVSDHYLGWVR